MKISFRTCHVNREHTGAQKIKTLILESIAYKARKEILTQAWEIREPQEIEGDMFNSQEGYACRQKYG